MATSAPSATPRFLPAQPENIPELLQRQPRWLCWKAGPPKVNGKFDKFPVDPSTGRKINGRDPKHWRTFAGVMDAYYMGVVDGIGFALSDQHPIILDGVEFYVTVADFDQCGARMDEIQALWRELRNPLTELSPSRKGLHMWGLARSPLKGGNAGDGRELYSGGRFVTMTGISAIGTFGECPGFASLEQLWFPPQAIPAGSSPATLVIDGADLPSNPALASIGDHWFDRLSPDDKNASLAAMLQLPAVIALADTPDDAPSPNWRTVLAACVRSGAPDAYSRCRAWAQTSPRFDPDNFDLRWRSYARG
jgi:hypothetical protein